MAKEWAPRLCISLPNTEEEPEEEEVKLKWLQVNIPKNIKSEPLLHLIWRRMSTKIDFRMRMFVVLPKNKWDCKTKTVD